MPPVAANTSADSGGSHRSGRHRLFSTDQLHLLKKALKQKTKFGPLSFLHCNMDGVRENIQEVKRQVQELAPSVVLMTNTPLDTDTPRSEQAWPFYRPVFCDDQSAVGASKGGMVIYILDSIQFELIPQLEDSRFQTVWFKIIQKDYLVSAEMKKQDKVIVVGNLYGRQEDLASGYLTYVDRSIDWLRKHMPEAQIVLHGFMAAYNKEWFVRNASPTNEYGEMLRRVAMRHDLVARHDHPTWFRNRGPAGDCVDLFLSSQSLTANCRPKEFVGTSEHKTVYAELQKTFCALCRVGFRTHQELLVHEESRRHQLNYCLLIYQKNRDTYLTQEHELGLKRSLTMGDGSSPVLEGSVLQLTAGVQAATSFTLLLQNILVSRDTKCGIVVEAIQLLVPDPVFTLADEQNMTNQSPDEPLTKIRLKHGVSYAVKVSCKGQQVGQHKGIIMVSFYHEEQSLRTEDRWRLSHMAVEFLFKVQSQEMQDLAPKAPYEKPKPYSRWTVSETVKVEPSFDGLAKDDLKRTMQLGQYRITGVRMQIIQNNFTLTDKSNKDLRKEVVECNHLLTEPLKAENYSKKMGLLMHCEESQLEFDIHIYDMQGVTMSRERSGLYRLRVPGLQENRPSVLRGDTLLVKPSGSDRQYEARVKETEENDCLLEIHPSFARVFIAGLKVDVRFTLNRFPLRVMHRAVELAEKTGIIQSLFPTESQLKKDAITRDDVRPFDRNIENNKEQLEAVRNIVSGTSGAAPYIVFGPPGTGKTVTMVEAIKQVVKLLPGSHIVAAAPSNAAADLLALRLLGYVGKEKILRLHASSRHPKTIPPELMEISNISPKNLTGSYYFPSVQDLQNFRVLVVTLVTASRLVSAEFPRSHFTHIFVDECGHAQEPESCIALAGLISHSSLRAGTGQIVLAGDPRQLGPVLRSVHALRHRLDISLLERLMGQPLYARPYNQHCITKLVKNFRSHPKLLELPSRLYYDKELVPAADPVLVNSLLHFEGLPAQARGKFPLIFHGVIGQDQREEKSPSFFNPQEVVTVLDYVRMILSMKKNAVMAKDIGVISPYRRQVQKIREKLSKAKDLKDVKDITVGSTEEFQGQERRVIIISCVRSSPEWLRTDQEYKLGFLKNCKRFNVAITRAKALLIVIGNPHILGQDPDWRALITYAQDNGGYKGIAYDRQTDQEIDSLVSRLSSVMIHDAAEDVSPQTLYEEPAWMGDH